METRLTPVSTLKATVDDILGDPGTAFRISMPIVAAVALVFVVVVALAISSGSTDSQITHPAIVIPILAVFPVVVVGFMWTAVSWHRHVILGEKPGALFPQWPRGHLLAYIGRSILVSLVVFAVSIVPLLLAATVGPTSTSEEGAQSYVLGGLPPDFSPLSVAIWAVLSALVWGISLRAGLILPARAIDRSRTLGEVWAATKGRFFDLFAPLGLIIAVVFAVLDFTTSMFPFGGVTQLISLWLQIMIGIGILTQLHIGFFGPALAAPSGSIEGTGVG